MLEFRCEDLLVATAWYGDGSRIGPVTGVYVDVDSGRPVWASVPTQRLVPLCRAQLTTDGRLLVALPPPAVEAAPPLPPDLDEVDRAFEDVLYAHYAAALQPVAHASAAVPRAPTEFARHTREITGSSRAGSRAGRTTQRLQVCKDTTI